MSESHKLAAQPDDAQGGDWLDRALRAPRVAALDDDGFTLRVMSALPAATEARAARVPSWRAPIVSLLWLLALVGAAISLPGVMQDVARSVYRLVTAYPVSLGELALAIAVAALVVWTVTVLAVSRKLATLG